MSEEETTNNTENASQYIKQKRGYLYYISMIFIVLGIALLIRNIYFLICNNIVLDLTAPIIFAIGGIFLKIDFRRKKRNYVNPSDFKKLSLQNSLAKTVIAIGIGIIALIILAFIGFILFFMFVPMGP